MIPLTTRHSHSPPHRLLSAISNTLLLTTVLQALCQMRSMLRLHYWTLHTRSTLPIALAALLLAACNSAEGPPVPAGVTAVSGNNQFATVGAPVANPLVVLVVDNNGNPSGNTPVSWRVTTGGGTLADTTSTSNASGYATMTYTAGTNPGQATIIATVAQIWTASFTVYLEPPSSSSIHAPRAGGQR
jgi:Bacterial Ig-like domain (group 1)